MESLGGFLHGFAIAFQPVNIFYCFLGCLMGTLVGVLPGIGPAATIALLLPTTYHLDPVGSIIMLAGICYGAQYGGSTTSILVNIPGEPSSIITCLDGYQMARKGRAGIALGVSAIGSFVAGSLSVFGLVFFAPPLARIGLKFGPPEYFSLIVMSLTIVTYLARKSMIKALIMAGLGLFLSTVGMDPMTSVIRFSFGIKVLYDGFGIAPVVMGLFGVCEVLKNVGVLKKQEVYTGKIKGYFGARDDWKRSSAPILRGTLVGFFLGIIPGLGNIVPTMVSYVVEKRLSKHPEKFGTGEIEGVAAPEACNNAAMGGQFIPLMSLGIPSSATAALLLAALMIFGLQPGPLLIKQSPDLFWGVIASMYIGNVMLVVLNLPLIPMWVAILRVPYAYLFPLILLFCLVGVYSLSNNVAEIGIMIFFGIIGLLLEKFGFELTPLILAFILGPLLEPNLKRSLLMSDGSFSIFFTRPIAASCMAVACVGLILPLIKRRQGVGYE